MIPDMSIQLPFKAQVQQHDISIRFHHNNIQQHIFVKPSSSKVNTTFDQQTTVHGLAGPGAIQCTQPKFQCFPIPFPVQPAFASIRFKCPNPALARIRPHSLQKPSNPAFARIRQHSLQMPNSCICTLLPAFARIRFKCQTHAFAFFCPHSPAFARIRPHSPAFAGGRSNCCAPKGGIRKRQPDAQTQHYKGKFVQHCVHLRAGVKSDTKLTCFEYGGKRGTQ